MMGTIMCARPVRGTQLRSICFKIKNARGPRTLKLKYGKMRTTITGFFAPELHFMAVNGMSIFVPMRNSLELGTSCDRSRRATSDPPGSLYYEGVLFTGDTTPQFSGKTDFTVLTYNNQLYACWGLTQTMEPLSDPYVSGALIASMVSPTSITAYRKEVGLMAEGPRAILRNNKVIMTGAAGGSPRKSYSNYRHYV